jgi:acetyl/propionyl-CoA carboxylase alpha subunit
MAGHHRALAGRRCIAAAESVRPAGDMVGGRARKLAPLPVVERNIWLPNAGELNFFLPRLSGQDPVHAKLLAAMPEKKPADTSKYLLSPMPGLLAQLMVGAGDDVKLGQQLAVVEAMKMENVLVAHRDVRVQKAWAQVGETLSIDQPIVEFE